MDVSWLIGKTASNVARMNDRVTFDVGDDKLILFHEQDCCESVYLEDVAGDLNDLIGSPFVMAEETSEGPLPEGHKPSEESETWTFYKFATAKGYVTLRWYGTSNGYYSERVSTVLWSALSSWERGRL